MSSSTRRIINLLATSRRPPTTVLQYPPLFFLSNERIAKLMAATDKLEKSTAGKETPKKRKDGSRNRRKSDVNPDAKGRWARRGTRKDGEQPRELDPDRAPRLPKRQCALLIGFCGTGCSGMQINPGMRTIEGLLFEALVKVGCVSQDNSDDPKKVNLGRAARTDAGVHAAGNVVSIKLISEIPGIHDIVEAMNEHLPPEIRVWGCVRVQNSFSARTFCDSRKYTYFFPSYCLIPPKPGSGLYNSMRSSDPSASPAAGIHTFWKDAGDNESKEDELARKRRWRIGVDDLARLRETARKYEATHNFHNFTIGREFADRSNQRVMKTIGVADPQVYSETEWIAVMFHGQSFMLHQRKMMAALVLSVRTHTPPQIIDELYGPRRVFVPKMPSLGLLLESPIFDSYNRRVEGINEKLMPDDKEYRPPISFGIYAERLARFKEEHIYFRMRDIEDRGGVFDAWIRSVDGYTGNDLLWLNPKGTIPGICILKKDERRANSFKERKRFDLTDYSAVQLVEVEKEVEEDDADEEQEEENLDKAKLADMEG
ncbi:pseudouridylate synthase [Vararia minispora EC-137]|uniref:Pseudouridylate synthase n=1 Tax=Vararia minispora EC-137 TaxID=1314806 RepID=A0ACB8QIN5_9AGAM|nr:pseudouridylate synthase [Vararia minispora EC-137]